jgi:hypothetical protein
VSSTEGDESKKSGYESEEEEQSAYISYISKSDMCLVKQTGVGRILRSGDKKRFPPTEMIHAANKEDGTYRRFDIEFRVISIINGFKLPTKGSHRQLYEYHESSDIQNLRGFLCYTASIKFQCFSHGAVYACEEGCNSFWEVGYVGMVDGLPYYSTKHNARRAVAIRFLVDYFSFLSEKMQIQNAAYLWTEAVMNKTVDNFVVLFESGGKSSVDDHLFCILLRHGMRFTLLIPRGRDNRPWKEIEFSPRNWSRKRK